MTALEKPFLTPEAYLEAERAAEFKSEYADGEVFAMAGATFEHNQISANAVREIGIAMKDRPCNVVGPDMKIWLEVASRFVYPDVSGLCGPLDFHDNQRDTYTNPQFIIEVLSDSTEAYDRGDKFFHYQTLPSLREYVLISQRAVAVEVFRKQGDDWIYRLYQSLDDVLKLDSVDCTISLREIYRNVEFPARDEP